VTHEPNEELEAGQDWEQQADNWTAWARKPGYDSYWRYRDEFFTLVPPPGRATLDLGCGEGRVTRDLTARGHRVTGIDASATMLAAARDLDPDGTYVHADAADLPLPDNEFDLVIAYNTLMDIEDLAGAVREATRVLVPGGRMCIAMTHPLTNVGTTTGSGDTMKLVLDAPYFETRRFSELVERDGMELLFQGWERPLSAYTAELERAGLLIEALREPKAVSMDGTVHRLPFHMWFRTIKATPQEP
jgi:ubiquinone/menaquinone biosynthesis C-methylase UbiE